MPETWPEIGAATDRGGLPRDNAAVAGDVPQVPFNARGYCDITVDEVDEAIRGLASPHVVIRRHAVCVLGERRLGATVAGRVMPLLGQTVSQDPDATVRRLAILSLLWWRKDPHRYANVVREALNDPAAQVREVAAYWLREQDGRPA